MGEDKTESQQADTNDKAPDLQSEVIDQHIGRNGQEEAHCQYFSRVGFS